MCDHPTRQVVGFLDSDGYLVQWFCEDCRQWDVAVQGTLFSQNGQFVLRGPFANALGELGRLLPCEAAAEMLLSFGHELPNDLVRYLAEQPDKPKIETRSESRRPRRPPKAQHGLAGFADSKRQRDSRAGFPETHDTQGH